MGLSLYSALIIRNPENDIRFEIYGKSKETGKIAGAINLYRDGFFHTTVVSTDPVFDSEDAAVNYLEDIAKKVKELNL